MSNIIKIKRGSSAPSSSDLQHYELGYRTGTTELYINDGGTYRQVGGGATTSGSNNQLLTDDGSGGITSEGSLTFDGNHLDITSGHLVLPYGEINDAGTDLNIVGTNAVTLQSSAGTALTIPNASTNVGIGTASPGYKLDVAGAGRFSGHLRLADGQAYIAGGGEDVQLFHSNTYGGFLFNQTNHFYFDQVAADKDWIFRVDDSDGGGDYQEVMRIQGSTQNVGIGTNSPDAKLEVTGSTNSDLFSLSITPL